MSTTKLKEYHNTRMIEATYVPCTDYKGSRVKIFERPRDNEHRQQSKTFSYGYEYNGVRDQAQALLEAAGFNIVCTCYTRDSYVFMVSNWGKEFKTVKDIMPI